MTTPEDYTPETRRRTLYNCRDRTCGATDCVACYPEARYIREDDEDDEETEN